VSADLLAQAWSIVHRRVAMPASRAA